MNACTSCVSRLRKSSKVRQFVAAGAANHGALVLGTVLGWGPCAFRTLVEEMEDISFNQLWTMTFLGALLAIIPCGISADKYGRRLPLLFLCFPALIGWLCIIFAPSPSLIYFGRFLTGFSCGGLTVVVPLYLTEITEVKWRGMLGFMFHQQILGGALLGYFSEHDSWRLLTAKAMPIPIFFFITMYFMPETPLHLLRVGKTTEALESLKWLRATKESDRVDNEFKEIQQALESGGQSSFSRPRSILTSNVIRPIALCMLLMLLNAFSGVGVITLYTMAFTTPVVSVANNSSNFLIGIRVMYLTQAGGPPGLPIRSNVIGLIMTIIPLLAIGISSHLITKRKRRPFLIVSSICMSLSLILLGILSYIQSTDPAIYWVKFTAFVSLFLASSFGLAPIPWLLMGELLPTHIRGIGSIFVAGTFWIASLVFTHTISICIYVIGIHYCFWFFAFICAVTAVIGFHSLPETCGKTFSEIQYYYNSRRTVAMPMYQ